MNKKHQVITKIFEICQKKNSYVFHNDLVKDIAKKVGFGNPFDATKIDNKDKLPPILIEHNYALVHLGNGYHKFIQGIHKIYHDFEPIQQTIKWKYKKSLLNEYNSSESNILSVANNQRILHHFLFGKDTEFDNIDISQRPKTYFPHRTKANLSYNIGDTTTVELKNIQIEIDLTIEYQGMIGVFEGKNGNPTSFATYQIYHPFLYYYNIKQRPEMKDKIKNIYSVYVVRSKEKSITRLKIWAYTFENPLDITTIKLVKAICYELNV